MKKDEVPQDEALFGGQSEIQYAENESGKLIQVPSKGWIPKTYALCQYWDAQREVLREAAKLVRQHSRSTLYYYMRLRQMDIGMLASYMGISKIRVWWHLRPYGFNNLSSELKKRYAYILKITPEQLETLPEDPEVPQDIRPWIELKQKLEETIDKGNTIKDHFP